MKVNPKSLRKKKAPTKKSLTIGKKSSDALTANQTFSKKKVSSSLMIILIGMGKDACPNAMGRKEKRWLTAISFALLTNAHYWNSNASLKAPATSAP